LFTSLLLLSISSSFLLPPLRVFWLFFLLGPKTDPQGKKIVREAIEKGEDVSVILLNYRKDGSTFLNQLFIAPLRDNQGKVINFLGVQCLVSGYD
jgi:PAS domain-containing protein